MDTTTLTVNVVDVVDPPPSFSMSQYVFTVNEGVANVSKQRNGVHLTVHDKFQIVHTVYFHSGYNQETGGNAVYLQLSCADGNLGNFTKFSYSYNA